MRCEPRQGGCCLRFALLVSLGGCALGIGKTGAAYTAAVSSDTLETVRDADQSGVAYGHERQKYTGNILSPSGGMGPRIGVNAGYKYGREFGTYDTKSVYDIASEGHVDIMIGFSRFALIVTHGTFNLILDKTQDRLNATEWGARLSYALTPYFSVNGGTMLMTDTTFMRNNLPSLVGSDGLRLLVGADFFIWQNWLINFGLKLDVSYGGSEAPFADGTTESYNGGTVMFQPYFTLL